MDLRYPVGTFDFAAPVAAGARPGLIDEIAAAPQHFREAVRNLSEEQLDTPYREGGWTLRQVVHHLADSHMNSYVRFHLAMTEHEPAVKGYDEAKWAEIPDARTGPVELSLALLDSLHARWVLFLRNLSDADFGRTFRHSEFGLVRLDTALGLYAWHSRHHAAHITGLRQRLGW
jgi:hypothetical protein